MTDLANLRNIALVGHPSSGKTTLADALAFSLGASDRKGSVGDKTSICDTEPEEQEKQHTLQLASVHAEKDGVVWNLIDTPGYPEFKADTISAMFATELTVGVVSCSSGVTFNLRQKMKRAAELGRGRAFVITHVDGENADFEMTLEQLKEAFGDHCVAVLVPDQSGHGFSAVEPATDPTKRKRLFDTVMDACEDEEVVMQYLDSETLSQEDLDKHTPGAILAGSLIPVLCCNPDSGVGVDEVAAWLGEFAPSPATGNIYTAGGEAIVPSADADLAGVVFNIKSDPHVGKVCLARIVTGTIHGSDHLGEGKGEKPGGLFHMIGGKKGDALEAAGPGEIVAFSKVEEIGWSQSFSVAGKEAIAIDVPPSPEPMVSLAVTPKSRNDEQKIGTALAKLTAEDPTFRIRHDPLTHEMVMDGMSDLHLQVMESRLKRRYGVEIETAFPRIAYRETVTKAAEGHHRHKKQSGGRGQFGECYVRVRPGAEDSGITFIDKVVGGSIPRNLIPAVEKGVREIAEEGIITHSRVVDVEVELYDGKFHAVDSDEASFKKAGARAFGDGFKKAGPVLQEPVMLLEVHVPADDAGTIFSDLTSQRRGHVLDQSSEEDGHITVIKAHVPLATVQSYHRDLKSQTAGEGTYTLVPDHYARVPAAEQKKVVAELGKRESED